MDLSDLSDRERLAAEQAVLTLRALDRAADAAPHRQLAAISGANAVNPRGLGTCVREDLMDLLIERNQLG